MVEKGKWRIPAEGLWGFSHCGGHDTWYPWSGMPFEARLERLIGDLVESGANSFRPQIHWHQVEPLIEQKLVGPEDVTNEMVEEYAKGENDIHWERYDMLIDGLVKAGIEPHMVVAAAYDFQIPSALVGSTCERAIPDFIGRDSFLAHAYLHTRAAVRRYRDRVHMWQLENELNGAAETLLAARWRSGRSWFDSGFLTVLMDVLSRAVLEEDPRALRSHNFVTNFKIIKGYYDWRNDVERWSSFVEIVGVDSYPNYIIGWPSMGRSLGKTVKAAVEVAGGKLVMVLECGYPAKPRHRGMSEGRQAEYARDAIASTVSAGGVGFFYYELCSPEGYRVAGPWSDKFFQSIEPWWGMVRSDDSRRPSWFAYKKAMEEAKAECARQAS